MLPASASLTLPSLEAGTGAAGVPRVTVAGPSGGGPAYLPTSFGKVGILSSVEDFSLEEWKGAFAHLCRDGRYYRLVEETLGEGFEYRYLALVDKQDRLRAIQPVFFIEQDLVAGLPRSFQAVIRKLRRCVPRLLTSRMLMVGCTAGEGEIGCGDRQSAHWVAQALHEALGICALRDKVSIIVLKDFPSDYRGVLAAFSNDGYSRIPSMPAAALDLNYDSFDHYARTMLTKVTRKGLRRKLRKADGQEVPLRMEVLNDITPILDELYPLYLQVYERARMKFEKLTPDYFSRIGQSMPDRSRFFVWRQGGAAVAFCQCMVHDGVIYDCYLGLDYAVALDLHLYFVTFRDIVQWSIERGIRCYYSGPLCYDPKLHLRFELRPLDLYVCHTSHFLNPILRKLLKFLQPARHDPLLRRFQNANEL